MTKISLCFYLQNMTFTEISGNGFKTYKFPDDNTVQAPTRGMPSCSCGKGMCEHLITLVEEGKIKHPLLYIANLQKKFAGKINSMYKEYPTRYENRQEI